MFRFLYHFKDLTLVIIRMAHWADCRSASFRKNCAFLRFVNHIVQSRLSLQHARRSEDQSPELWRSETSESKNVLSTRWSNALKTEEPLKCFAPARSTAKGGSFTKKKGA